MTARYAIGLGGNIGNTSALIGNALDRLQAHRRIQMVSVAGFYRSAPWGRRNQAAFVNTCAILQSDLSPHPFLRLLQTEEHRMGRVRRARWGARTLDLDVLWWSEGRVSTPQLFIPHPRMTRRAFVLKPLAELIPNMIIGRRTVLEHLNRLPQSELRSVLRLPPIKVPRHYSANSA